jgi:hypothetical protein
VFEVAVEVEALAGKIGGHRRGDNGDDLFVPVQGFKKLFRFVRDQPRVVGAGSGRATAFTFSLPKHSKNRLVLKRFTTDHTDHTDFSTEIFIFVRVCP